MHAGKSQDGSIVARAHSRGEWRSVYREMETKSLVKCILFLGHTSRFVSHFPRMSPAISFVCWIRRGKDTDYVYVSFSRRKGFRRDRFSLQYFLPPFLLFTPFSFSFSLALSLSIYPSVSLCLYLSRSSPFVSTVLSLFAASV